MARAGNGTARSREMRAWSRRRRLALTLGIFALSLALRVIAYLELAEGPCLELHRWDQTDMHFFDAWARDLSSQDWLTDKSLHPYLGWHRAIARRFATEFPARADAIVSAQGGASAERAAERLLWDHWYGGKQYHQEPIYPYLIAAVYTAGGGPRHVLAVQLLLGALSNVLLYWIARRHFGDRAGAVAGLLAVLSGPLFFFDLVLLRSSLITFIGLLVVYLADLALERRGSSLWFLTGIAGGVALLIKSTFATFALVVLVLLVYRERKTPRVLLESAGALLLGGLLLALPLVTRNLIVGAPPLSTSSVGPLAFACSNTVDFPAGGGFFVGSPHLTRILARSDCRLLPAIRETVATHPSAGSYLAQLGAKFLDAWKWYEKPNNVNFYYFRLHSAVLRYLPVTFFCVAPLGILGLLVALRRGGESATLYALVLTQLAPLVLFYNLARFRAPLAASMIPFAALALVRLVEWAANRRWPPVALSLGGLVLVALWTARPPGEAGGRGARRADLIRPQDHLAAYRLFYEPRVEEARKRSDWKEVERRIRSCLAHEPKLIGELGPERRPETAGEAQLIERYGEWRHRLGIALEQLGRPAEAEAERRQSAELLRIAREFFERKPR